MWGDKGDEMRTTNPYRKQLSLSESFGKQKEHFQILNLKQITSPMTIKLETYFKCVGLQGTHK